VIGGDEGEQSMGLNCSHDTWREWSKHTYPFFVCERSPFVSFVLPHVAICLKDEHKNRAE
jgi:hypothetical protein